MEEFIDGGQLLTLFRSSDLSVWSKHFKTVVKVANGPQSRPTEKEHLQYLGGLGLDQATRLKLVPPCISLCMTFFLYGVIQLFQFGKIVLCGLSKNQEMWHCVREFWVISGENSAVVSGWSKTDEAVVIIQFSIFFLLFHSPYPTHTYTTHRQI